MMGYLDRVIVLVEYPLDVGDVLVTVVKSA